MLGGLSGALVDMDGSETGVFRITGVPAGSTFGGKGRNLGGGVWEFAPAEMAAPLTFAPPQNLHGVFNLVLEGVTTESANGDRATVSRAFTIEITAVADAPATPNVTATGDEDTGLAAGAAIPLTLTDADGSERVSSVAISAPPAGWVFGTVAVAGVTYAPDGAGGLIVSGPTTAAIRAALDGLTVTPPANADDDAFVSYTVTTTDADGSTASATGRLDLVVRPVGDGVALSATPVAVEEDSWVNFGGAITLARRDNDGSEEITRIEVTGFGTASARWTLAGGAAVTAIPGGYAVTGGTQADRLATLASFEARQAANSDADIALTIRARTTDRGTADSSFDTLALTIAVDAQADAPTVSVAPVSGSEDAAIVFGTR